MPQAGQAGVGQDHVGVGRLLEEDVAAVGVDVQAAGAGLDVVVAAAAMNHGRAAAAVDEIVARPGEDLVAAGAGVDGITIGAAVDVGLAAAGVDEVGAEAAEDAVVAGAALDHVEARLAGGRRLHKGAVGVDQIAAVTGDDGVITRAALDVVAEVALALDVVVALAAEDGVVADAAVNHVVADAAADRVVALAAGDGRLVLAGFDQIVAAGHGDRVAVRGVGAVAADQGRGARGLLDDDVAHRAVAAGEEVLAAVALDVVEARAAGNGVGPGAALERGRHGDAGIDADVVGAGAAVDVERLDLVLPRLVAVGLILAEAGQLEHAVRLLGDGDALVAVGVVGPALAGEGSDVDDERVRDQAEGLLLLGRGVMGQHRRRHRRAGVVEIE